MAKKKSDKAYFLIKEGKDNVIELEVNGTGGELISMLVSIFLENKDIQDLFAEAVNATKSIKEMENEETKTEEQNENN